MSKITNDDSINGFIAGVFVAFIFCTLLLAIHTGPNIRELVQEEAIKHNAAYYHPETGVFTWKEDSK